MVKISPLICEDCSCEITVNEYANYDEKCEWCYATHLGHKVFECCKCVNFKTLNEEDMMFNVGRNYYCHSCGKDDETDLDETDLDETDLDYSVTDLDETDLEDESSAEFW